MYIVCYNTFNHLTTKLWNFKERIYRPKLGPEMIGVKQLGQLFELLAKVVDDREKVLAEEIFGYVQVYSKQNFKLQK